MDRVFDFGSNWKEFSERRLDERRLSQAVESLKSLLRTETLAGSSFLDVGCGSGLFSIAASMLGARPVVGVDINSSCIAASRQNRDRWSPGAPIDFRIESALDPRFLEDSGEFDIVYAWGSVHHTGAMWSAIQNISGKVSSGGILVLSIYNQHLTSPIWKIVKWIYNRVPGFVQRTMEILFAGIIYVAKFFATRRNPLHKQRGMDFWYDVVDWIGGYPYEYAHPDEVIGFLEESGFSLRNYIPAEVPTGCNEFVFTRVG